MYMKRNVRYFRKNRDHSGSSEDPLQYCRSGTLVPYALHFGYEDNSCILTSMYLVLSQ